MLIELISGVKPSAVWTGQQSITALIQREAQPLIHTFPLAVLHKMTWADKQAQNQNCFAVSQQFSPLYHCALCHYAVQYLFSKKSHTNIYKINCQIAKTTEWSTEQSSLPSCLTAGWRFSLFSVKISLRKQNVHRCGLTQNEWKYFSTAWWLADECQQTSQHLPCKLAIKAIERRFLVTWWPRAASRNPSPTGWRIHICP